jgi:hypothetical protein
MVAALNGVARRAAGALDAVDLESRPQRRCSGRREVVRVGRGRDTNGFDGRDRRHRCRASGRLDAGAGGEGWAAGAAAVVLDHRPIMRGMAVVSVSGELACEGRPTVVLGAAAGSVRPAEGEAQGGEQGEGAAHHTVRQGSADQGYPYLVVRINGDLEEARPP